MEYKLSRFSIQLIQESDFVYRDCTSPYVAASIAKQYIGSRDREHLIALFLNSKNDVIGLHTISIGTLNSSVVHPREVFKAAILSNARGIILAHNHPSGDTKPSKEDISTTENLVKAGKVMGIQVLDHIIVGPEDEDYSFQADSPETLAVA